MRLRIEITDNNNEFVLKRNFSLNAFMNTKCFFFLSLLLFERRRRKRHGNSKNQSKEKVDDFDLLFFFSSVITTCKQESVQVLLKIMFA